MSLITYVVQHLYFLSIRDSFTHTDTLTIYKKNVTIAKYNFQLCINFLCTNNKLI